MSKIRYPTPHGGSTHEFQLLSRAYRVLMDQDKRRIYDFNNDILQADNYDSNEDDIEELCSLENSLMSIGIGSGLTNCFYQGRVCLNFDDIMCKHNMLFCKLCNLSIVREQLEHILWKHLVVEHQIYQPLPSDHLD